MKAIRFFETSDHARTTRRHIPENSKFHSHRLENLKSYIVHICLHIGCIPNALFHIFHILLVLVFICNNIVTDLIKALPDNSSVNTVQHAAIDEAVFSMWSAPSSVGTTGLCNPFLSKGSVNTLPRIGPCYESGDVNNIGSVFHGVGAECL
jgi:hypothetical protein